MGCWLEVRFDARFLKLVMKCTTALGATVASLGFGCCDGGGRRRMFEGRVGCCCGCCEEVLGASVGPSVDVLKELRILSFFALKLFWLQPDISYTDMSSGGKCFGTKNIDNEREHEVAALVCGSCSLKSNMLSGVYAVYAGVVFLHVHSHVKLFVMYACIYIYIPSYVCVHFLLCLYDVCFNVCVFVFCILFPGLHSYSIIFM